MRVLSFRSMRYSVAAVAEQSLALTNPTSFARTSRRDGFDIASGTLYLSLRPNPSALLCAF